MFSVILILQRVAANVRATPIYTRLVQQVPSVVNVPLVSKILCSEASIQANVIVFRLHQSSNPR